jgi:hypothetical protein
MSDDYQLLHGIMFFIGRYQNQVVFDGHSGY